MKKHSDFVNEVDSYLHGAAIVPLNPQVILTKVIEFSRMGIAPEGKGSSTVNAIVDSLYNLNAPVYQPKPAPPETVPPKPRFTLSAMSLGRLGFLLPQLVAVVKSAITCTEVDFGVSETIRTLADQEADVKAGKSRTMQSLHLKQADGFAHAVDLFAWIEGKTDWTPKNYGLIAHAMWMGAQKENVAQHIRWGGAWDRVLSDFNDKADFLAETESYAQRHAGSDLIDMPHFEWRV